MNPLDAPRKANQEFKEAEAALAEIDAMPEEEPIGEEKLRPGFLRENPAVMATMWVQQWCTMRLGMVCTVCTTFATYLQ